MMEGGRGVDGDDRSYTAATLLSLRPTAGSTTVAQLIKLAVIPAEVWQRYDAKAVRGHRRGSARHITEYVPIEAEALVRIRVELGCIETSTGVHISEKPALENYYLAICGPTLAVQQALHTVTSMMREIATVAAATVETDALVEGCAGESLLSQVTSLGSSTTVRAMTTAAYIAEPSAFVQSADHALEISIASCETPHDPRSQPEEVLKPVFGRQTWEADDVITCRVDSEHAAQHFCTTSEPCDAAADVTEPQTSSLGAASEGLNDPGLPAERQQPQAGQRDSHEPSDGDVKIKRPTKRKSTKRGFNKISSLHLSRGPHAERALRQFFCPTQFRTLADSGESDIESLVASTEDDRTVGALPEPKQPSEPALRPMVQGSAWKGRKPSQSKAPACSTQDWSCPACTLLNPHGLAVCKACGEPCTSSSSGASLVGYTQVATLPSSSASRITAAAARARPTTFAATRRTRKPDREVEMLHPLPQRGAPPRKPSKFLCGGLVLDLGSANAASGARWMERPASSISANPSCCAQEEAADPELACYLWDRRSARPKGGMHPLPPRRLHWGVVC